VIVGKTILRISLGPAGEREALPPTDVYDRQVRAFGREGQQALARTTVAIIGAGGTGSACGEMLARLGVGRAILIDDDSLELSNVSRVFGSTPAGVGKAKVDLLAAWMRRINPAMKVQPHAVNLAGHVSLLKEADIVLSCTDTETSRSLANQFASQFLRPLVDLGNRIDASEGRVVAASARLTHVVPGGPCMECFNSINHSAVRAENLSKAEYSKLRAEGYVEGLTEPAPSVVSLNAFVASLAITKFLDIVTGIGGLPHPKYTFSYLEGELRAASVGRREKCICRYFEAYGDLKQVDFTITG
jgi:molybdopterin/thiamine biosynthesis adenylyltransferase